MKRILVLGFLFVCTITIRGQSYENPADLDNYNNNWTHLYNDSLATSSTSNDTVKFTGKVYNIRLLCRTATLVYKTTKARDIQGHWIPLLANEERKFEGCAGIDSLFIRGTGTGAAIVEWTKF